MNAWIPAISTTSALAITAWLCRSLIATRLAKSVQFEFDRKLEALRSKMRESEEAFKSDLRTKESEIAVLRSGAISALASRQAALDKRRIEAADHLWKALIDLGPAKGIAMTMTVVKFESTAQLTADNPEVRKLFAAIGGGIDRTQLFTQHAELDRPFVPDIAWALFSAYRTILSAATVRLEILKSGLNLTDVIDVPAVQKLILAALPHQSEFVKKAGIESYYYLLDELETRLLSELRKFMQGGETDKASIDQAAEILKQANAVMQSLQKSATS